MSMLTNEVAVSIEKLKKTSSYFLFNELRLFIRARIKYYSVRMQFNIFVLKSVLYTADILLDIVTQYSPVDIIKQTASGLNAYLKEIRIIYEDIKNIHYSRLDMVIQQMQYLPKNPKEAKSKEAQNDGWKKATENENWYHRNNGGINNVKYYNIKTGQEVIYESDNDDAKLVTSVDNIGTFNYYPPKEIIAHWTYDVLPYWLWGNSKEDNTSLLNRLFGVQINRLH